jgi:hypothetical protein
VKQISKIFDSRLQTHKTLVSRMVKTEDKNLIIPVDRTGKKLALVYAEFKCEKCGSTDELQYHHLLQKTVKSFVKFWKYISQRYYWANIAVLCKKCHQQIENRGGNGDGLKTIPQKTIDKVKKEFKIGEDENYGTTKI